MNHGFHSVEPFAVRDTAAAMSGRPPNCPGSACDLVHAGALRFRSLLDSVDLISLIFDRDNRCIYCNEYFLKRTGWGREEVLGRACIALLCPPDDQGLEHVLQDLLNGASSEGSRENLIVTRSGERRLIRWHASTLLGIDGGIDGAAILGEDITAEWQSEDALAQMETHDRLTGLPRFLLLENYLESICAESAMCDSRVMLVYVNLDRVHVLNETRGHAAGDAMIKEAAHRLRDGIGDRGFVAHVAGNEFAIGLPDESCKLDQVELGEQIRNMINGPVDGRRFDFRIDACMGVSCFPENATSAAELLRQAEWAMQSAKAAGRGVVVPFRNADRKEFDDRIRLGLRLGEAMERDELVLHFQPRVCALRWRICGFEALLRWDSPEFGLLPPGRFLKIAEAMGLMASLDEYVLERACAQAREWIDAGAKDFILSVNIYPPNFLHPGFVSMVHRLLEKFAMPPGVLELELTEGVLCANIALLALVMDNLRKAGVRLSLDDFGTGYSSLGYLRRLPVDTIKIDRGFVTEICSDPGAASFCRAIIALGHQLGMSVVAEGVEKASQVGYLCRAECDSFQGFYFGSGVQPDDAFKLMGRSTLPSPDGTFETAPSTLLLVDDERNVLNALTRVFRGDGFRILTASSAQEALDVLGRCDVQVVVSDQRMPGMNGTDLLCKIKELHPEAIRIILTGFTDLATIIASVNDGSIYKFAMKPWHDNELRELVRGAFREFRHRTLNSGVETRSRLRNGPEHLAAAEEHVCQVRAIGE